MKISKWNIPKTNQLWISWKAVRAESDGSVLLLESEFSGPVLSDSEKIEETGHIFLDFTSHFVVLIQEPYILKLSWNKCLTQDTQRAKFDYLKIEKDPLGWFSKLKNISKILLDCTGHTTEDRARGLIKPAFTAILYKEDNTPYDFSSK